MKNRRVKLTYPEYTRYTMCGGASAKMLNKILKYFVLRVRFSFSDKDISGTEILGNNFLVEVSVTSKKTIFFRRISPKPMESPRTIFRKAYS